MTETLREPAPATVESKLSKGYVAVSGPGTVIEDSDYGRQVKEQITVLLNEGYSIRIGADTGVDFITIQTVSKYAKDHQVAVSSLLQIVLPSSTKRYRGEYMDQRLIEAEEKGPEKSQALQALRGLLQSLPEDVFSEGDDDAFPLGRNDETTLTRQKVYDEVNDRLLADATGAVFFTIPEANSRGTGDFHRKAERMFSQQPTTSNQPQKFRLIENVLRQKPAGSTQAASR